MAVAHLKLLLSQRRSATYSSFNNLHPIPRSHIQAEGSSFTAVLVCLYILT